MSTAIRGLALASLIGMSMLAGNVSTAKAGPYDRPGYRYNYPRYRAYAYPYAYTPYAYNYGYPGYASYTPYYGYGYASPGVTVGGYWGGRGYYGHGRYWHR